MHVCDQLLHQVSITLQLHDSKQFFRRFRKMDVVYMFMVVYPAVLHKMHISRFPVNGAVVTTSPSHCIHSHCWCSALVMLCAALARGPV